MLVSYLVSLIQPYMIWYTRSSGLLVIFKILQTHKNSWIDLLLEKSLNEITIPWKFAFKAFAVRGVSLPRGTDRRILVPGTAIAAYSPSQVRRPATAATGPHNGRHFKEPDAPKSLVTHIVASWHCLCNKRHCYTLLQKLIWIGRFFEIIMKLIFFRILIFYVLSSWHHKYNC